MIIENFILVQDFCSHHHLEATFVYHLQDLGLVEVASQDGNDYLPLEEMGGLERLVRLHQELGVHPDDLDIVSDLVNRLDEMEQELSRLRNRLSFYEQNESEFEDF